MKFIRLFSSRSDVSAPRLLRLSPPGSLRVIDGEIVGSRKPVRFSTRMRSRAR